MERANDTRVIYFSDLFFAVLHAWRKILVVALVFAMLFGGVQTVRYMQARNTEPSALSEETLQNIAELETKLEVNQEHIASIEDYLSKSTLMNLNPYQVYQATANIFVEAETLETASAVTWAYQSFLRSYITSPEIAQALDIDADYLAELVYCQILEEAGNLLTITTSYSDAAGAEQLLSGLLSGVNSTTAQVNQEIAPHTIRIISYPTVLKANQSLQKQQSEYTATLETLKTDRKTMEKELASLNTNISKKSASPVIVAAIGALAGAAIVICIIWVHHFVTDKVYSARTLKNRVGVKVLGCMPLPGKHRKIDTWLCKLENRACYPEQASIAAAAVAYHCRDAKHLLILGNYDPAAFNDLQRILTENGIAVTDGKHVLYSLNGANALVDCDAVLLLETCNRSLYAEISKSIEVIADHEKRLLGCILLGG